MPVIKDFVTYRDYLIVFSSFRIKFLYLYRENFLKAAEDRNKTFVAYDIDKVRIIVMHFVRLSQRMRGLEITADTKAYLKEIGLKLETKIFIDNFSII